MAEQNFISSEDNRLVLGSKKKWWCLGILVALFNPVVAGLLLGAVYLSEPELKNAGRVVSALAILWGAILFYLLRGVNIGFWG